MKRRLFSGIAERRAREHRRVPHVVTRERHAALVGGLQAGGGAQQRALARAIGAQEPRDLARAHDEGDAIERAAFAIRVAQVLHLDHDTTSGRSHTRSRRVEWMRPAISTPQPMSGTIKLPATATPSHA